MKNWKFVQVGNDFVTKSSLQKALQEQEQLLKDAEKMLRSKLDSDEKIEWQMAKEDAQKQIERIKEKLSKVGNESIDKQEWSMFKGLAKDAEKEVWNRKLKFTDKTDSLKDYVYDEDTQDGMIYYDGKLVDTKKHVGKGCVDLIKQKAFESGVFNKVGNATGDEYNAEIQRLTKKAEQLRRMGQGRSAMEVEKQIEKLGKELRELGNKKTGNGTPGSIASIGPAWMHGGTVYGKMNTDESGKRHNEYVKITWLGEGKGGVANYFIDDRMQSDKLGSLDKNELKRWAEQKIGNEETKAERKFGKVMGEFKKGTLKSSSGETVTNPEQAKAIAYSESEKVDNLKRARNAMAKNQQITLWKGNDSALISDNGLVQYLENNSFETDRDKYESQEVALQELAKKGYVKK